MGGQSVGLEVAGRAPMAEETSEALPALRFHLPLGGRLVLPVQLVVPERHHAFVYRAQGEEDRIGEVLQLLQKHVQLMVDAVREAPTASKVVEHGDFALQYRFMENPVPNYAVLLPQGSARVDADGGFYSGGALKASVVCSEVLHVVIHPRDCLKALAGGDQDSAEALITRYIT